MAENKRMANYELLRILAMVMVVVMHFLSHSDSLPLLGEPLGSVKVAGALIEAFCLVAVNVYLLISGYFGVKGSFKPSKVVSLWGQILFYSLLIPVVLGVLSALGVINIELLPAQQGLVYGLLPYVFPIGTEHYWFATSYFMLYLLTPVLNGAVKKMNKRQLQIILGGLLLLFCVIKSIVPVVFAFDRYGYDLPWFICVYLVGAYLGLYGSDFLEKRGWLVYVGSCLASLAVNLSMWALAGKWDSFSYYFTVPYHYNYILCLTGAIGLFYGFGKISIKEGNGAQTLRNLGALSFGIYLFHEHIELRDRWYGWIQGIVNPKQNSGMGFFFLELICSVVILFMAGIVIDFIRKKLFGVLVVAFKNTWVCRTLDKLDMEMAGKGQTDA